MRIAWIALGAVLLGSLVAADTRRPGGASATSVTRSGLVSLLEESHVAAQESGVLKEVLAQDGQQVAAGQRLALIDPTLAILERNVRETELHVARKRAKDTISVDYARSAAKVYERDYLRKLEANRRVSGSVPKAEIELANLQHEQYRLQTKKSEFELEIAALEVKVSEATLEAAEEHVRRREITAPWDGIVEKVARHTGDWVQPGDPVLRLVRMDRLRIKCFLNAAEYAPAEVVGRSVTVVVEGLAHAGAEPFHGKVVGASPMVEANNHFLVWAEVENRKHNGYWVLRDGLKATVTIALD